MGTMEDAMFQGHIQGVQLRGRAGGYFKTEVDLNLIGIMHNQRSTLVYSYITEYLYLRHNLSTLRILNMK